MSGDRKIRVGSRKSELALIQTKHVISLLKELHPERDFEIITMSTLGDKILDIPLPKIGEKSLFTKELEHALTTGCVDFLVHSLKDLPTTLPDGMAIGAVLCREDPRDALVLHRDFKDCTLQTLPENCTLGTSSLRRTAQLARKYPHLKVENIRGNLNTRLHKLDELGQFQGIILATAGLERMGWHDRISQILENDELLYAVGQGALAVECRESDQETIDMLRPLYDSKTALCILAERSFLCTLGGGCSAPVAVCTDLRELDAKRVEIKLKGAVWSLDGKDELVDEAKTEVEVREKGRCAKCPYGFKREGSQDLECTRGCKNARSVEDNKKSEGESASKRPKLEQIPVQILKDEDPHQHCPIEIPVGADFMGKCPYLDSTLSLSGPHKSLENVREMDVNKCPFFKDSNLQIVPDVSSTVKGVCPYREPRLYCGLVAHVDVPQATFEEVHGLGVKLAERLIKMGAGKVMAKAQAHIRGSV